MDQKTTTTNQVSVISSFINSVKRLFSREYTRSVREDWIYNIILKILDAPGTVKLTPSGDDYYLANSNYGYYVRINYQKMDIVCGNTTIAEPCTAGFIESVKEDIRKAVLVDVKAIEEKIDNQGTLILKKLDDTIAQ